jgi:predicted Holliday junction resolvase-like endonuclease
MPKIQIEARVTDLLSFYRTEHRIFGRCPHCGDAFRLSEVKLTYGKEPPRDALTTAEQARERLEDQLAEMRESYEDRMADRDAWWRGRVHGEVVKGVEKEKKEIRRQAVAQSRRTTLGRIIERVAPWFSGYGHHPADVRPVFDPVDFVVFDGLYATGEVSDVVFVEFKTGDGKLTSAQRSIREAVARKRVHFEPLRMTRDTMEKLACRKLPRGATAIETVAQTNGH